MRHPFFPLLTAALTLFAGNPKARAGAFTVTPVDYLHSPVEYGVPAYPLKNLRLRAALSELETGAFAVHADKKIGVEVTTTGFSNRKTGRVLDRAKADLRQIEFVPADSLGKERLPLRLVRKNTADLAANQNAIFFLTLVSSDDKDTGPFSGFALVKGGDAACSLAVEFYVRPFRLGGRDLPRFSTCITSEPIPDADMAMMKSAGIESFECFMPKPPEFSITDRKGRPQVSWPSMDTLLIRMKRAGMAGPVILMLGNDRRAHLEFRLCEAYPKFKMTVSDTIFGKQKTYGPVGNPAFDTLYVQALGQIIALFRRYGIAMDLVIFDEAPERFMPELPARYRLIRSHFPRQTIVGVAMGKLQWVKSLAPYSDAVWIGGEFHADTYFLRKIKKPCWFYCFITSETEAGAARGVFGLRNWKYDPAVMAFWAWNYYSGDPFVEYDGEARDREGAIVYPGRDGQGAILSPAWIGVREAVDDWHYARMLEEATGRKGGPDSATVRDLKMTLADHDYNYNEYPYPLDYTVLDSIREACAEAVLKLKK